MIGGTRVIGVTGTIGSGKSLVGRLLQERGYPVIDTDQIVHELFEHDSALKDAIRKRFGDDVLQRSGVTESVDRARLSVIVFNDADARHDLEGIVHPATIATSEKRIAQYAADGERAVFVLVPLLFEAKQQSRYDEIWTVRADEGVLRPRLQQRNNLSEAEIDRRLKAQLSQEEKASRSHRVVDNSGSIDNTRQQVESILAEFQ